MRETTMVRIRLRIDDCFSTYFFFSTFFGIIMTEMNHAQAKKQKVSSPIVLKKIDNTTKTDDDNEDMEEDELHIEWEIQRDYTLKYYRRCLVLKRGVKKSFKVVEICNHRKEYHKEGELLIRTKDDCRVWLNASGVQNDYGINKTNNYLKSKNLFDIFDIGLHAQQLKASKEQEKSLLKEKNEIRKMLEEKKRIQKKEKMELLAQKKKELKEQKNGE
jgi:hypothetical protein